MEHIYPAFERGRIMKKELLWALRDSHILHYSYSMQIILTVLFIHNGICIG